MNFSTIFQIYTRKKMKKLITMAAAFGLAMTFTACGDDSSSNSGPEKDSQGRTIYHDMQEAMEAPCSDANQCEEIIMDDPIAQDTLICLGTMFQSKIGRDLSQCAAKLNNQTTGDNTSAGGEKGCLISYSDGTKKCNTGNTALMLCGGTGSSDGVSFTSETVNSCPAGENLKCADTDGSLSFFYDASMTECPSWLTPAN